MLDTEEGKGGMVEPFSECEGALEKPTKEHGTRL